MTRISSIFLLRGIMGSWGGGGGGKQEGEMK